MTWLSLLQLGCVLLLLAGGCVRPKPVAIEQAINKGAYAYLLYANGSYIIAVADVAYLNMALAEIGCPPYSTYPAKGAACHVAKHGELFKVDRPAGAWQP